MINRICIILLACLVPCRQHANTITISTAASSASGWSYSAGVITATANVTINNAAISSYLVSGNLTIEAGTDISVNGNINPALGAGITRTLTLRAAGNITIDAKSEGASSATATGWFYGILMIPTNNTNNAYGTASIESTSGNITISATARHNQNINHNAGIAMFTQNATATARVLTHSGNITITGSNLNVSNPSYGGIFLTGAGNEQIVSRTGNITLQGNSSNSSIAGINANSASQIGYDGTNPCNGNIELIADNISFSNTAAALQSSGNLRISPVTGNRAMSVGTTGGLALPAAFFAGNCINGFSSIRLGNSSYTGNMAMGSVTFQDNMIFETTGTVTQTGAITAASQDITLLGVDAAYTLTNAGNNVRSLTANTGSLQYTTVRRWNWAALLSVMPCR